MPKIFLAKGKGNKITLCFPDPDIYHWSNEYNPPRLSKQQRATIHTEGLEFALGGYGKVERIIDRKHGGIYLDIQLDQDESTDTEAIFEVLKSAFPNMKREQMGIMSMEMMEAVRHTGRTDSKVRQGGDTKSKSKEMTTGYNDKKKKHVSHSDTAANAKQDEREEKIDKKHKPTGSSSA